MRGSARGSRWVAPGVAALAVVGVIAATGVYLVHQHHHGGPAAGSPAARAESAAVRASAARVYSSFAGTTRQRDAGGVLRAYAQNGGMDECLEAAGYPEWDWSKSRQYATPTDPLAAGTWLAEPHRPFRSLQLMAQRSAIVAEQEMNNPHLSPGENRAIGRCLDSGPHKPEHAVEGSGAPKAARRLVDAWYAMVEGVASHGGSMKEYDACMDAAHIPALVDAKLPAARLGEAVSHLGPVDSAIPSSNDDPKAHAPAWQAFLASEKAITDADWQCRRAKYDGLMAQLGPEVDEFAAGHAADIQAAQEGWALIESQAESLGFSGQVGPLGQ